MNAYSYIENVKRIEKLLFDSKTFKYLKDSKLDEAALGQVCAEIFKQAVQSATNLEELAIKERSEALALEKMRMEIELSILNTKAQITLAEAEALKSMVQARAMIVSTRDNAAINRANCWTGFTNAIGNATEQTALNDKTTTDENGKEVTEDGVATLTMRAIMSIKGDDDDVINDFEGYFTKLKNKDENFGCKDVIIHTSRTIMAVGEVANLVGISSFGDTECRFKVGDEVKATNTKNFNFTPESEGEFVIKFEAEKEKSKGEFISDAVSIKVVDSEFFKKQAQDKKF
jgi:hypothetical protein